MFHVKQILNLLLLIISYAGYGQKMLMFKETNLPMPKVIDRVVTEWNEKQPGYKELSLKEQQFYYWVNYSRLDPERFYDSVIKPISEIYPQLKGENLKSLEKDLKDAEKPPLLSLNASLGKISASHARDITSNNANPSHTSTNGETFADRFKRFGLNSCGGENISYGAEKADVLFMLVLLYLDINVADLGHRKALLNPSYIYTGISEASYKNGNAFIVEDFACTQK